MSLKIGRNDPCWCGSGRKYKTCHEALDERIKKYAVMGHVVPNHSMIKTPAQIEGIREAAKVNVAVLDYVAANIREGMSTQDIDDLVSSKTKELGGICAPLGYEGYPKSVCTSVNEVVCHGIPSPKEILKSGDIINVDCTTIVNGFYADSSRMFLIGDVSPEKKRLVQVTKEAMELGLKEVRPWSFLGNMADAVNRHARANGYSVVKEIGGHGVGVDFHEDPWVGYYGSPGTQMLLVPGMMFTIEPMINMGKAAINTNAADGWRVTTKDKSPSAQWEIQVLVTEDGNEVISW